MALSDDTTTLINSEQNEDKTLILTHAEVLKYLPDDGVQQYPSSGTKRHALVQFIYTLFTTPHKA